MIVAAGPPLTAIVLTLGALGWLDFRLNMFLNVMTPLIMVISFSDSMQLTFAARDRLIAGESKAEAFRNAILVVGPACVLTHATAGLSFVALLFSNSDLIRTFAEAGIIATVIALVTVLMLLPILGMLLIREETAFAAKIRQADAAVHRAAPVLRLDRAQDGDPGRALQPRRRARRRRARLQLRQPAAALPARRSGARQGACGARRTSGSTPSSPAPIRSTC